MTGICEVLDGSDPAVRGLQAGTEPQISAGGAALRLFDRYLLENTIIGWDGIDSFFH